MFYHVPRVLSSLVHEPRVAPFVGVSSASNSGTPICSRECGCDDGREQWGGSRLGARAAGRGQRLPRWNACRASRAMAGAGRRAAAAVRTRQNRRGRSLLDLACLVAIWSQPMNVHGYVAAAGERQSPKFLVSRLVSSNVRPGSHSCPLTHSNVSCAVDVCFLGCSFSVLGRFGKSRGGAGDTRRSDGESDMLGASVGNESTTEREALAKAVRSPF